MHSTIQGGAFAMISIHLGQAFSPFSNGAIFGAMGIFLAEDKTYVLTDGGGLHIDVLPSGTKVWLQHQGQ